MSGSARYPQSCWNQSYIALFFYFFMYVIMHMCTCMCRYSHKWVACMWKTEMESGILLSSLHPVIWDRVSPKLELGARNLPVCTLGVSADHHGIPLSQELRVWVQGLHAVYFCAILATSACVFLSLSFTMVISLTSSRILAEGDQGWSWDLALAFFYRLLFVKLCQISSC